MTIPKLKKALFLGYFVSTNHVVIKIVGTPILGVSICYAINTYFFVSQDFVLQRANGGEIW